MKGAWIQPDKRDAVVDFVGKWSARTELPAGRLVKWIGIGSSKFYEWKKRYGRVNQHNGQIPRDFWLEDWERRTMIDFYEEHPLEGYRRLTYMMLDRDIIAVSPTTMWRVLNAAGLLGRWNRKTSKKGTGFTQPLKAHDHWHVDISYVNVAGTFYFLCSVLDGFSRSIVHWDLRESIKEVDVEIVLQAAREKYPEVSPRIITDNGPQFIARDFKEFIRISGMTHVRTSPYYPQSNGKIERWHQSLKRECIRPGTPLSLEDAKRLVTRFVEHYNTERLHSAIGYITPKDKLEDRAQTIFKERDHKLEAARETRRQKRQTLSTVHELEVAVPI